MKTWVITGGMGCGKTFFLDVLFCSVEEKVEVFSADAEVRRLMSLPETLQSILEVFGPEAVIQEAGADKVNRDWLRGLVFSDPSHRSSLEALLHPGVLSSLEKRRREARVAGVNLFLAEVPLHYEIQSTVSADLVIVVASSRAVQVRRLMETRGLDQSIIEKMLSAQLPIEAKVEKADVVIWNDGRPAALEAQALTLARQIRHE